MAKAGDNLATFSNNILVVMSHPTDLFGGLNGAANGIDAPKSDPDAVAAQTLDGVQSGAFEVLADDISRHVRQALSGKRTALYPSLAS